MGLGPGASLHQLHSTGDQGYLACTENQLIDLERREYKKKHNSVGFIMEKRVLV